jgi:DNA-directed RNA polymerase subunit alpha
LLTLVRATVTEEQINERLSRFVVEPLEPGFGYTVGNAMRRTLLSSVPGAAISLVKVEGVLHEFTTIPGVTEDVTELVLNIKDIVVRMEGEEPSGTLQLRARGPNDVTAADIETPAGQREGPARHGADRRARDRLRGRGPDEAEGRHRGHPG